MKSSWYTPVGLVSLLIAGFILLICYIDRPVVFFLHAHRVRQYSILNDLQKIPKYLVLLLPFTGLWWAYRKYRHSLSLFDEQLLLGACNYVAAISVNALLKIVFGRALPITLFDDGVYGFFWFEGDTVYHSFPSGHTAAIYAVATILWCYYPCLRWISSALCILVMVGLIGRYDHFVSDVLAGAIVGIGVSYSIVSLRNKRFHL